MVTAGSRRILLLGPTGVAKTPLVEAIRELAQREHGTDIRCLSFERDALTPYLSRYEMDFPGFLRASRGNQRAYWLTAWEGWHQNAFRSEQPLLLTAHAGLVWGDRGSTCIADVRRIADDFRPTLIITLLEDVYSMWWRTEERAGGVDAKGRPNPEQLMMARRTEVLLADLLASLTPSTPAPRHVVCSVNHPVELFWNLVARAALPVYLSFPITAPRKLSASGDTRLIEDIDRLHRAAREIMRATPSAFISPLAIDELPLVAALEGAGQHINFSGATRWSVRDLWGDDVPYGTAPRTRPFDRTELANVAGIVRTDVGWRDFRLVEQSKALAVYCPVPPGEKTFSGGVFSEIRMAQDRGIVCFVFQPPEYDPDGIWSKWFVSQKSALGNTPGRDVIQSVNSMEDLLTQASDFANPRKQEVR